MKRKLVVTKDGRVWIWQVREGRKNIAGGFCKTKKDAENDGRVWMRLNAPGERPGQEARELKP